MSTTEFDLTESIVPKSDQLNSDDLISGPRTVTIAEVRRGSSPEQPFDFILAEFPKGRPFKPSKTVRRLMVTVWGPDAATYVGKRLTLFRDPSVKFGGESVGGIRVSAMSGLDKVQKIPLTETRGKKKVHVIEPLPDAAPSSPPVSEETVARLAELRAEWEGATPERREAIKAEVATLEGRS